MLKAKTTVLSIDRGAPRGFYVFWTTDGGSTWLTSKKRALRSERELTRYHKVLAERWPDVKFERVQNPDGTIPKAYWKDGEVGTPLTVVEGVALRGMKSEPEPKRPPATPQFADLGPVFEWKSGSMVGVEVRRNFNFRSLSVRIEGDRPTVKTLQEWQRFILHLDEVKEAVTRFSAFVEESKELKVKAAEVMKEVEQQFFEKNRDKIQQEFERKLNQRLSQRTTRRLRKTNKAQP